MTPLRKTALAAGVFYLLSFASVPTLALYAPVRGANYIVGPGPDTGVIWGGVLEMIVAVAGIGTAVVLYPVVKRQNETLALGFVGTRLLEAATIISGVSSAASMIILPVRSSRLGFDGCGMPGDRGRREAAVSR